VDAFSVNFLKYFVELGLEAVLRGCLALAEAGIELVSQCPSPPLREYISGSGGHTGQMRCIAAGVLANRNQAGKINKCQDDCGGPYGHRKQKEEHDKVRKEDGAGSEHSEYCAGGPYHRQRLQGAHRDEQDIE